MTSRICNYKKINPEKLGLKSNTCLSLAYPVKRKQGVRVAVLARLPLAILLRCCEKGKISLNGEIFFMLI